MTDSNEKAAQTPQDQADPASGDPSSEVKAVASGEAAPQAEEQDPLAQARAEADRLKDMWMRTAADFDNFRKRSRREIEEARRGGREDLLRAVLPVFDNLERAIQSAQRAHDVKAVADGLSLVLRQFTDAISRVGIAKIPTVGAAFDPTVHEAIQQVETADHPPGTVIAEVQPGYVQGDRLVRAAMVIVAKPKDDEGGGSTAVDGGSGEA